MELEGIITEADTPLEAIIEMDSEFNLVGIVSMDYPVPADSEE